ncbi:cytochrome P450 [Xylariaceae sp. FL1651]|nr:cytochrome P450 [Xylariaceae sp. FL1651]
MVNTPEVKMIRITFATVFGFTAVLCYPLTKYGDSEYLTTFCRVFPACLLIWIIYGFLLYPNLFSPLRHLPTVDGSSWWSIQSLRLYREPRGVPHSEWVDKIPHEQYGLVRYRSLFNTERVIVATPEALAEVLTTKSYQFKKPQAFVTGLEPITGMGLLLTEGDQHKAQRKALLPAFSFRHIKQLYSVMWKISSHAVNTLACEVAADASKAPQQPFTVNISDRATQITLDTICVAGLGQQLESVLSQDAKYVALREAYNIILDQRRQSRFYSLLRVWVLPSWLISYVPLKRNKELAEASQTLHTICKELIRQKKEELESELVDKTEKNILTVALASNNFTEEELVNQLLTFLAAGFETTAIALTWAIYTLSVNTDMQTRLRDEVRAHLPSPSSAPSSSPLADGHEDLSTLIDNHMPYLDAICQEVLRYYSPLMLTFREAAVDTTIQGTRIPAGTQIDICPRATNRDKSLWGDDAKVFNPDRYLSQPKQAYIDPLDDNSPAMNSSKAAGTRSNYAMLTFLHGPRSCIGQSFSRAELAIVLASLVGRFEFRLADESLRDETKIKKRRGAINRPIDGIQVKVTLVEGW